jgi:CBS domain-containing protein
MHVFDKVSCILRDKGSAVFSVAPDTTLQSALQIMADRCVGCLLVMKDRELVGIFSERDYARKAALWWGRLPLTLNVGDLMHSPVITIAPDTSINEAMCIMTQAHVRHLPVLDYDHLVGLVSIGDVVKWTISSQDRTIRELQNYITGQYDVTAGQAALTFFR